MKKNAAPGVVARLEARGTDGLLDAPMVPPRSGRLGRLAANLAVFLIGVIAAGLLLEVMLRVYNPFLTRIKRDHVVLLANRQVRYRSDGRPGIDSEITITLNVLGFRGPNPPSDFAHQLTLIAIGGSTTQCGYQSDEKTWPAVLGQRLQESFRDVWMNNVGIPGHTTHGHLAILRDYVAPLHPKLVLFLVGINDVARASSPGWDREFENVRSHITFSTFKAFLKWASAYSEAVALCVSFWRETEAYRGGLGYGIDRVARLGSAESTDDERQRLELSVGPRPLRAYADRLTELIVTARAAGIEPVLLTQPIAVGLGVDEVSGADLAKARVPGWGNGKTLWEALEAYNDITRLVCRDMDVLLVDLAHQVPKGSRYFADFMHFNNDGAVLVAEIIDRSLCPEIARLYPQFVLRTCPETAQLALPTTHEFSGQEASRRAGEEDGHPLLNGRRGIALPPTPIRARRLRPRTSSSPVAAPRRTTSAGRPSPDGAGLCRASAGLGPRPGDTRARRGRTRLLCRAPPAGARFKRAVGGPRRRITAGRACFLIEAP